MKRVLFAAVLLGLLGAVVGGLRWGFHSATARVSAKDAIRRSDENDCCFADRSTRECEEILATLNNIADGEGDATQEARAYLLRCVRRRRLSQHQAAASAPPPPPATPPPATPPAPAAPREAEVLLQAPRLDAPGVRRLVQLCRADPEPLWKANRGADAKAANVAGLVLHACGQQVLLPKDAAEALDPLQCDVVVALAPYLDFQDPVRVRAASRARARCHLQ